jgi:hypothetical protein
MRDALPMLSVLMLSLAMFFCCLECGNVTGGSFSRSSTKCLPVLLSFLFDQPRGREGGGAGGGGRGGTVVPGCTSTTC